MTSINNTYDHEEKMKTLDYLESKLQDHGNLELPILNRDTDTDNRLVLWSTYMAKCQAEGIEFLRIQIL